MIAYYSKVCEGCTGNQALTKIQSLCKKNEVEFQERRTILWERYEEEAEAIAKEYEISLPFFYGTESGLALEGNTFTPTEELENLVKAEKKSQK